MRALLSLAVLLLPVDHAVAGPVGRQEARALTGLFIRTCFRHPDDVSGLRAVLVPPEFVPLGKAASASVLSRPGRAYQVAGGHLMVLSFDDGWCGDGGAGVDPAGLTVALADAMRAGGTHMTLMGANRDGHEQRYLLERPPAAPIALLVMMQPAQDGDGRQEPGSLMQASLFAAPMPDTRP